MNNDEDIEEYVDETQDQYDATQELQEAQIDQYANYPTGPEKSDIYNWFWKVVRLNEEPIKGEVIIPFKLSKVGNLSTDEIGFHGISIRDSMNLAYLGNLFNHKKFGEYWATRARITSTSSMSKKGWFMDLSISQRKIRERAKKSSATTSKGKWRLFEKRDQQVDQ